MLAAQKLGVTERFKGSVGDDPSLALEAMKEYDWLIKARFEHMNLRIKVPFLHRNGEGWDLYFLHAGLFPRSDDMQFYCETVWVLRGNGIDIKDYYVIHLNKDYVRRKELDTNRLFIVSDCFYNNNNRPGILVKEAIESQIRDMRMTLLEMEGCDYDTLDPPVRTSRCSGRQKCRFYEQCFPNESVEEPNAITTLIASQYRYAMAQDGIQRLRDAQVSLIEGTRMQYAQIRSDFLGGQFVDRLALRSWMSYIKYPITFLDFEWERYAIPPYEGMRPFDVMPFEYSIHVLEEDGTITHKVYLSVHDDRRDLARNLINDVRPTGTVIAYNADAAEKIRIQELAEVFKEYADSLLSINERMEDLQAPFTCGAFYDTRMRGLWSLKVIMALMDDPGYKALDIQGGMDAVFQWRHLDYGDETADSQKIIEDLKAYCGMDSYAMTVVFRWLKNLSLQPLV